MWQDLVISGVQVAIVISLLPTVFHPTHKPTIWTSIFTATCLYILAIVYVSLEFWLAVITVSAVATLWVILAVQRYRLNRKEITEPVE